MTTAKDIRAKKHMNSSKQKVRKRVVAFIDSLNLAAYELSKLMNPRKNLCTSIQILSRVRSQGPSKNNQGLILLDQYFSVPQIGEVIRDLLILDRLALGMDR